MILHVGVSNKYYAVDAKAEQLGREPTEHICFKNWSRDQSSSSREKAKIKTLISDGDSSVYNALVTAEPYGQYGVVVRKIECENHLFRNFCKKVRVASGKAIPRSVSATLSTSVSKFREKINTSGLRIRQTVGNARDFLRQDHERPKSQRSSGTDKDYGPYAQRPDRVRTFMIFSYEVTFKN